MTNSNTSRITYLIGAGASFHVLPTVDTIKDRLHKVITRNEEIPHVFTEAYKRHLKAGEPIDSRIIEDFKWLSDQIVRFKSPDTLAKVFTLVGGKEGNSGVKRIKDILTTYFYFEELVNSSKEITIDPRYIHFLASIVNVPANFPERIKILSWNYDFQLELAADAIRTDNSMPVGQVTTRRSPPLVEYYPGTGNQDFTKFNLIHLNGSALVDTSNDTINSLFHRKPRLSINEVWHELKNSQENRFIRFSWEDGDPLEYAKEHLLTTEILVIIGYSFPYFNRGTDNQIFDYLKRGGLLSKIYFQNPTLDGQFLYSHFNLEVPRNDLLVSTSPIEYSTKGVIIEHVKQVEQFHIPFEY